MESTIEEVSRLKTGTVEQKMAVVDRLATAGGPAALKLIIEALDDPKWVVRRHAADALGRMGPVVLEPLGKILASGTEDQRFWAVKALVALGRAALPLLLRALTKGSKPMRIYAASALGSLGDDCAVEPLVLALGDPVWRVRKNACTALQGFGERALPALQSAMSRDNEDVVFWAAKVLGKLGEASRDVLLVALRTGSESTKFIVAAALAETGDTRIVSVLVRNCAEGSWIVQKRSAEALGEIGRVAVPAVVEALSSAAPRQAYWLLLALTRMGTVGLRAVETVLLKGGESFRWSVKDVLADVGEAVIPVLERLCSSDERDVRFFSVTCLGELSRTASADDVLLRSLADPSWSIRKTAADALASRGTAVLDRLNLALETGDEDLRFWVTYIFRKMGSTGLSYLIRALGDSNKNIAYFAASALGDVQDDEVVRPLIRALGDVSWPVRRNAADSLKRLARFAVPQLVNCINDENEDIQYWVGRILEEVGAEHLEDVITKLRRGSDEERFFAAKALGVIKEPRAVEPLIAALTDGHEWVRLYAAIALGEIGDRRALTHLIGMLGEPGFKFSGGIARVFQRFGEAAVPELLAAVNERDSPRRRAAALKILGTLRSATAFDLIVAGLEDGDPETRACCVDALACYTDRSEVVPAIVRMLGAAQPARVRTRAVQALGEVGGGAVVEPLVSLLHTGQGGKETHDGVLNVLCGLGAEAVPHLMRLLGDERVGLRKAAADTLAAMGAAAAPALESAAKSDDANVRFWAVRILKAHRDGKLRES